MNPRLTLIPAAALALLSLGCSDAAPTPAAVGLQLSVIYPDIAPPGTTCPATGSNGLGDPPPSAGPLRAGGRITDGNSDVDVKCTVRGESSFAVSAEIAQGPLKFNVSGGTIDSATGTGTFNASFFSPAAGNSFATEDEPCQFDLSTQAGQEDAPQVKAGTLFARFNCPTVWNRGSATPAACGASGVLVLEYCED